jgi:chemotaxis protein MotB
MSATAVAAAAKSGRRRKHEEHEEHENHERWLITYADMITLLMVLFIVLFAIGQTDLEKFRRLQEGLAESFGNDGILESGQGLLPELADMNSPRSAEAEAALDAVDAARAAIAQDRAALEDVAAVLDERLSAVGARSQVDLRVEQRGLIVTIVTDQVLFDAGSSAIRADGEAVLLPIADAIADLPNPITVEGHTDDRPISTGQYASNWELSTARATSVLRLVQARSQLPPSQLAASGYADTRPIGDNATAEGRAANRRVEIVVHSLVDGAALAAGVAGTDTPPTTIEPITDPIPEVSHGQEEEH